MMAVHKYQNLMKKTKQNVNRPTITRKERKLLHQNKPFLTSEQWHALLVITTVVLVLVAWFVFSFMLIVSPYGG
jgi:hypothetical protein